MNTRAITEGLSSTGAKTLGRYVKVVGQLKSIYDSSGKMFGGYISDGYQIEYDDGTHGIPFNYALWMGPDIPEKSIISVTGVVQVASYKDGKPLPYIDSVSDFTIILPRY
jgi:hypothetical protein